MPSPREELFRAIAACPLETLVFEGVACPQIPWKVARDLEERGMEFFLGSSGRRLDGARIESWEGVCVRVSFRRFVEQLTDGEEGAFQVAEYDDECRRRRARGLSPAVL